MNFKQDIPHFSISIMNPFIIKESVDVALVDTTDCICKNKPLEVKKKISQQYPSHTINFQQFLVLFCEL